MSLWKIDLAVILVASACCLAIGLVLIAALRRTRQLRRNRLALVTALLFTLLGLGELARAFRYFGLLGDVEAQMRAGADWWRLSGDLLIASVAVGYWLLRPGSDSSRGVVLFSDLDARERQAFQLTDEIVQGLASIAYALELGKIDVAKAQTTATLEAARVLADGMPGTPALRPEGLVRDRAATLPGSVE